MARRNFSKTYKVPKRPYESERLDQELKISGSYGLANKREIWRVVYVLSRIRRAARNLLMLDEGHPTRIFEGGALLRRLVRIGVLNEGVTTLEDVFGIKIEDFLDRRLQSLVYRGSRAKSIHQARVVIRHGHIGVGKQKIDIPSFIVRVDSEKHIGFLPSSTIGGTKGREGRTKRRRNRVSQEDNDAEEE